MDRLEANPVNEVRKKKTGITKKIQIKRRPAGLSNVGVENSQRQTLTRESLAGVFYELGDDLKRFLSGKVGSGMEADEIVQDVFLGLLREIDRRGGEWADFPAERSEIRFLVFRRAMTELARFLERRGDHMRSRANPVTLMEPSEIQRVREQSVSTVPEADHVTDLEEREFLTCFYLELARLDTDLRECAELLCIGGLSRTAVAQVLGLSKAAVQGRVTRALLRIGAGLEERGLWDRGSQ